MSPTRRDNSAVGKLPGATTGPCDLPACSGILQSSGLVHLFSRSLPQSLARWDCIPIDESCVRMDDDADAWMMTRMDDCCCASGGPLPIGAPSNAIHQPGARSKGGGDGTKENITKRTKELRYYDDQTVDFPHLLHDGKETVSTIALSLLPLHEDHFSRRVSEQNVLRQPCRNGDATKSMDSDTFDGMARWSGFAVTEVCFTSRCYLLCQFCINLALSARVTDGMELRYRGEREAQKRGGGGRVKRCRLLLPVVSTKQRPALLSVNSFRHPPLPPVGPPCQIHPSRDTGRDIPTGVTAMRMIVEASAGGA